MSADIKMHHLIYTYEQLSDIADSQHNSVWLMIEDLPNRKYKTQVSRDLDLLELSRRIKAYLETKKAMKKASGI